MKKIHFTIPSSDGRTTLHGIRWEPDTTPKAIFQMNHGMAEYIDRYSEFAHYLCDHGYAVIGHDHLGHGQSVVDPDDLGFFAEQNGASCLLKDMHRITRLACILYPDVPVFLFGHSMGSFLARRYISLYGNELSGVILCGCGEVGKEAVTTGMTFAAYLRRRYDSHYRSKALEAMALGPVVKAFGNKKRPGSWLSPDPEYVEQYKKDPLCGFRFTVGAYEDFFRVIYDLDCEKGFHRIPRDLPILLISGMEDALGGFTKKVLGIYNNYIEMGMTDVDVFFYQGQRHELVQGQGHEDVWSEVRGWLDKRLP